MSNVALKTENLVKRFGTVTVLKGIDIEIEKNEIHAIVGENGAGKSTLIKVISGDYDITSGKVYLNGEDVTSLDTKNMQSKGFYVISQNLNIIPSMTVAQNILSGNPPLKNGFLDWKKGKKTAEEVLRKVSDTIDLDEKVVNLSAAEKQLVTIARSIVSHPSILVLDEPTSRLGMKESEQLFNLIKILKQQGVTMIYISHRMEEIYRLCDRVSIFRDGERVLTKKLSEISEQEMVSNMLGKSISDFIPKVKAPIGEDVLNIQKLKFENKVKNVSINVKKGEIVGLVGSVGAGKTEILDMIFGAVKPEAGTIEVSRKVISGKHTNNNPENAIKTNIAYVTEDRQIYGLVMDYTIRENLTLVDLDMVCKRNFVQASKEKEIARTLCNKLLVRPNDINYMAGSLSGGNMQKVCIGKWMMRHYDLYLMDEVTAGIDVGAKTEIYHMMGDIVKSGSGILLATSDIVEALGVCDRLVVLHRGEVMANLEVKNASKENVLMYMMGGVAGDK